MHSSESSNGTGLESNRPTADELTHLIKLASVGNRDSQKTIYDHLAARSFRVIRKIVGPSDADDVMQEFIIQLFSKLAQFRFESSFETWAHRLAVNQSLLHLRKKGREEQRARRVAWENDMTHNPNDSKRAEDTELLSVAMEQISGEQRAILHMKEVEGLGYETISTILGIPVGTVGSRLNKARKELRNTMIQLGWDA